LEFQIPDFRVANFILRRIFCITNLVKGWTFFGWCRHIRTLGRLFDSQSRTGLVLDSVATDGKPALIFQKISLAKIFVIGRPNRDEEAPPAKSRGASFEISDCRRFSRW
jgi:hypothetical protein